MKQTILSLIALLSLDSSTLEAQTQPTPVTLNQCIEAALTYNPIIKEAGNATSISDVGIKTAQSGLFPVIASEVSGGFSNEFRLGKDYKTGSAKISMDQALWQHGKITSSIAQARYNNKASEFQLEGRKQDITLSVKTVYYNCLQQSQLYETSLDNITKVKLFLDYATERFKAGVGRKSDVLKAESDLKEADYESNLSLNALQQARNELAMLTGIEVNSLTNLNAPLLSENNNLFSKQPDSLYAAAITHYPELLTIINLEQYQEAKIKETKADLYPRVSVNAGYDWSYNPTLQEQKGWYSVLSLRWNLFNGHAGTNQVKVEQLRKNIYENQAEQVKIELYKEINNKLVALKEATDQISLSESLVTTTTENLETAQAQYQVGTGSMLELADARIYDLKAKQKIIQAVAAYQMAVANLERLIVNSNH